ncbi:hypothetical protein E3N88_24620 [Mikania micrantha]|uniref:NAC domain-containing protein n=1 Tax=Mikania micrantha TaxID=192012 RepID=A0A5N6N3C9_9ASTR|nr:hypothetical protein E3N88_24620 [Mikania micrantha]
MGYDKLEIVLHTRLTKDLEEHTLLPVCLHKEDENSPPYMDDIRPRPPPAASPIGNLQQQPSSASNCIDGGADRSVICCFSCVRCHCGCHAAMTMAVDSTVEGDNLDSLPIGYRFVPTDEELIDYLMKKIKNETLPKTKISEAHIYRDHLKDLVGFN